MAGNNQGAVFMDPRGKSDFDAGLLFFGAVARMMPGLKWDDLLQPHFMAGWWTDLKHSVGDVKDGIGDVLKDSVSTIGSVGGDTVRLAASPDVAGAIQRAATAYATGGASEGANSLMDSIKSIFTPQGQQVVQAAGASYKQSYGLNPWIIGGAVGVGALLLIIVAKK